METLTKRSTKGSALTHAEMDANWDKITNGVLAVETQMSVALNPDGTLKNAQVFYAATTNGTDNYAIAIAGNYTSVADFAGRVLFVLIDTPNTGPCTLTINTSLTDNILKQGGRSLASGDIKPGVNAFMWDPTTGSFLLMSPPGSNSQANYGVTSNIGNDYTITVPNLATSTFEVPEIYYAGYRVLARINAAPTGPMRLKIASVSPVIDLGFVDVRKYGIVPIDSGDLAANQVYELVHDGTSFQLIGQTNNEAVRRFTATGIPLPSATGRLASPPAHGLGGVPHLVTWAFVNKGNASGVNHGYAVGDRLALSGYTQDSQIYQTFHPIHTATLLDMVCLTSATNRIWSKTGVFTPMSIANFNLDFELEVTAIRFST